MGRWKGSRRYALLGRWAVVFVWLLLMCVHVFTNMFFHKRFCHPVTEVFNFTDWEYEPVDLRS